MNEKKSNTKKKSPEKKEATISQNLEKLDEILKKMEEEDTGLEESFKLYEEGLLIVKRINAGIDKIEKRIEILASETDSRNTDDVKNDKTDELES